MALLLLFLLLCLPASAGDAPYVGMSGVPVPKGKRNKLGLASGMTVTNTIKGCPGEQYLQRGDILHHIDQHPVSSIPDMIRVLGASYRPGQPVTLKLLRNGQPTDVKLTLTTSACARGGGGAPSLAYASPFLANGTVAPWGEPTEAARLVADFAGQAAGKLAGRAASEVASKVPIPMAGGMLSQAASKAASTAANNAVLNLLSQKLQADFRFASACELGQHLATQRSHPAFAKAVAAVNTVYADDHAAIQSCMGGPAPAPAVPGMDAVLTPALIQSLMPPAPSPGTDLVSQLESLKALYDAGALTHEEFTKAKERILSGE